MGLTCVSFLFCFGFLFCLQGSLRTAQHKKTATASRRLQGLDKQVYNAFPLLHPAPTATLCKPSLPVLTPVPAAMLQMMTVLVLVLVPPLDLVVAPATAHPEVLARPPLLVL